MEQVDLKFDVMFNARLSKELNKLMEKINEMVDNINYIQDKWEEDHRSLVNVINANVTLQLQIEELKLKKLEENRNEVGEKQTATKDREVKDTFKALKKHNLIGKISNKKVSHKRKRKKR